MRMIPSLFFAAVLTLGYYMFFHAQADSHGAGASKAVLAHPATNDPYKADMDRAHFAADQMLSARQEADGVR